MGDRNAVIRSRAGGWTGASPSGYPASLAWETPITPLLHEAPAIVRCLAGRLLLSVDTDERSRPGRVVVLAVAQDLAVEGHLTGRGRFPLLSLASRRVN